jgi:hypothetical protein
MVVALLAACSTNSAGLPFSPDASRLAPASPEMVDALDSGSDTTVLTAEDARDDVREAGQEAAPIVVDTFVPLKPDAGSDATTDAVPSCTDIPPNSDPAPCAQSRAANRIPYGCTPQVAPGSSKPGLAWFPPGYCDYSCGRCKLDAV